MADPDFEEMPYVEKRSIPDINEDSKIGRPKQFLEIKRYSLINVSMFLFEKFILKY